MNTAQVEKTIMMNLGIIYVPAMCFKWLFEELSQYLKNNEGLTNLLKLMQ
jgi:hypothetical protein